MSYVSPGWSLLTEWLYADGSPERQATAAAVALWQGAEAVVCFRAPAGGKLRRTRDMQVAICLHVPVR